MKFTWSSTAEMERDATRYRALVESGMLWPSRDPRLVVPAQGAKQRFEASDFDAAIDRYMRYVDCSPNPSTHKPPKGST